MLQPNSHADRRKRPREGLSIQIWRFIFLFAGLYCLYQVRLVLVPLVLGVLVAYVINPALLYLERFDFDRTRMLIVIYLLFIFAFVGFLIFLTPNIRNELQDLKTLIPKIPDELHAKSTKMQVYLDNYVPQQYIDSLISVTKGHAQEFMLRMISTAHIKILNAFTVLSLSLMVIVISFFFLKDGNMIYKSMVRFIPNKYFEQVLHVICQVDTIIGNYLRGQFIESFIVGILTVAGLFILKLKYGLLIGISAGILNVIPYVGPTLGAVPAIIVSLVISNSPSLIPVILVFIIVQTIDNIVLKPIVIGKSVEIHPIAVFMALLIGGSLFGMMGVLVAIPAYACIKVIFKILYNELIFRIE